MRRIPPSDLRERLCTSKVRHETRQAATARGQDAYFCRFCGGWHATGAIKVMLRNQVLTEKQAQAIIKSATKAVNNVMKTMNAVIIILAIVCGGERSQADDRNRHERREHRESHNYIIERQQAYMVQGTPTSRLIIGKREIDGYSQRDGSKVWFEKNNVVGVTR